MESNDSPEIPDIPSLPSGGIRRSPWIHSRCSIFPTDGHIFVRQSWHGRATQSWPVQEGTKSQLSASEKRASFRVKKNKFQPLMGDLWANRLIKDENLDFTLSSMCFLILLKFLSTYSESQVTTDSGLNLFTGVTDIHTHLTLTLPVRQLMNYHVCANISLDFDEKQFFLVVF